MLFRSHTIKAKSTTAEKVIITSKNFLDLSRQFTKTNCTILDSTSLRVNMQDKYYVSLFPHYLCKLLQELDGYTITLSIAKPTNGILTMYVSYTEGKGTEANSEIGETSVSLTLDHQGRQIKNFEIRPYRRGVAFTDTETVIEDIQLEISDTRTDFVKPHSEIYQIVDVVNGECEVDSLGTAMTIVPNSVSAEVEVEYNVDTKKYVDNAIENIEIPASSALSMMTDNFVLSALSWSTTTDEAGEEYHFIDITDIALPSSNNITIEMDTANDASIIERKASIEASLFVTTSPNNVIRIIALTKPVIDIPVNIIVIYEEE